AEGELAEAAQVALPRVRRRRGAGGAGAARPQVLAERGRRPGQAEPEQRATVERPAQHSRPAWAAIALPPLLQDGLHGALGAVADDGTLHRVAGTGAREGEGQVVQGPDAHAGEADDDVARLQPRALGRATRAHPAQADARRGVLAE